MRILKKPYFTLLEMLIVLLLLSAGMGLTGVKIKQAYNEQRRLSDVQQVLSTLTMAQDLMLMLDADVEVVFSKDYKTKQVTCQIFVEKLLDPTWTKLIERPIPLSIMRSFHFTDHYEQPLRLRFTLGKMSQGILTLSTKEQISRGSSGPEDFKIMLAGYPSPIMKINDEEKHKEFVSYNKQLYPHSIHEELYSTDKKSA